MSKSLRLAAALLLLMLYASTACQEVPASIPSAGYPGTAASTSQGSPQPADAAGGFTGGPPMAELLAAIAIRIPDDWYVSSVTLAQMAGALDVSIKKWAPTFKDFKEGRAETVSFELSPRDVKLPLASLIERINAITPRIGGKATTRPARGWKLLGEPVRGRSAFVGPLSLSAIHMHFDGPRHGYYYKGSMTDRRSGRKERIYIFAAFSPFPVFRKVAMPSIGQVGDVLAVRAPGARHVPFNLAIPMWVFTAASETSSDATSQPATFRDYLRRQGFRADR